MGMLLGFSPFIVFALLTSLSVDLALWAAFATAFAVAIRDFAHTRLLRGLEVGSTFLFGTLALYRGFVEPSVSFQSVRLVADGGLLLLAAASVLRGTPFTFDYARAVAPREVWSDPHFIRTNYVLAGVWLLALAAMTTADALATFDRHFPVTLDVATGLAALTLAVAFTARYPVRARARVRR